MYDVNIEGVSLVSNYRTQFNKIIQTSSFNELIQKLRTKQEEFTGEPSKAAEHHVLIARRAPSIVEPRRPLPAGTT